VANTTTLEWLLLAKDQASDIFEKVGSKVDKTAGKFDKVKGAAAIGMAAAGVAVVGFAKSSVDAYSEAEESQNRLQDAFNKFPALADTNIGKIQALNSTLATKTKFDDDATASGQAVLAQFGVTGQQLTDITPLLQDYAAKTGKDLPTAAQDLGKAMLGQGKALKGIGLNFKDAGSASANFDQLMGGLRSQVGGFAEKEGGTAAGKAAILTNQFGELQEKVGGALMPALTKLTDIGTKVVAWLTNTPGALQAVSIALGIMAIAWLAVTLAASPWLAIGIGIAAVIGGIVLVVKNWGVIGPWLSEQWGKAMAAIGSFFSGVWTWIKTNWPLLLAILTGPIGLAVLFIARNWDSIKAGAGAVVTWITDKWNGLIDWFKAAPGKIAAAAGGMFGGIWSAFTAVFNRIAGAWNNFHLTIGGGTVAGVTLPSITLDTPNIPLLARGGTATRGGLAIVGEQGAEVVRLGAGDTVFPTGTGPGGMTHLHPDTIDALGQVIIAGILAGAGQVTSQAQTARTSALTRRSR
jgi:hypothetical protein